MYPPLLDHTSTATLHCNNPACSLEKEATVIHEGDTNASYIHDNEYTCEECGSYCSEEKPDQEITVTIKITKELKNDFEKTRIAIKDDHSPEELHQWLLYRGIEAYADQRE